MAAVATRREPDKTPLAQTQPGHCHECNITVAPYEPGKVHWHGLTFHGSCFKTWVRRQPDHLTKSPPN